MERSNNTSTGSGSWLISKNISPSLIRTISTPPCFPSSSSKYFSSRRRRVYKNPTRIMFTPYWYCDQYFQNGCIVSRKQFFHIMRFEEVDDAACLGDLQNKIGQRTSLVA